MTVRTDAHLRSSDAFTWYMERDPLLRSTIVTVGWYDTVPEWQRLLERFDAVSRLVPHFRHRIIEPPLRLATPRWTVDRDFDLSWHVRLERVPAPGSAQQVLEFARRKAMTGFDPAHALWELTVLTDLDDGGAAVVMKIHHALTDGVGGMEVAKIVFDLDAAPRDLGPLPPVPEADDLERPGALLADALVTRVDQAGEVLRHEAGAALPALAHAARHPASTVEKLVATTGSVYRTVQPAPTTLSPLMTDRHLGRRLATLDVPFPALRAAARTVGCSVNDAYLTAVTGGLRQYHELHGAEIDELRVTLPISIRKDGDPIGGNRITLQRLRLPATPVDPRARMVEVGARARAVRAEPSLPLTNSIAAGLNLLPPALLRGILKQVDFLASNVCGPPCTVYLAGAKLRRYYAFGPTIGSSLNLTLLSYCGTCHVAVNMDTAAVTDPELLVTCLRAGFDEVTSLASATWGADPTTRTRSAQGAV